MKRILVLDANQRSALAVTRSLGKHSVSVYTADTMPSSLAGQSKFSTRYLQYPSPVTQPEAFIATIIEIQKNESIDMLLPVTELTTELILREQHAFCDVILPFASSESIDTLSNKCRLMQLAESYNIPTPQTWFADSIDGLTIDLNELPYPLVLKPGKSWLYHDNQWLHTAVRFASDASEARQILDNDSAFHAHPFMLQEYIPGKGGGVFALYDRGAAKSFFAHRRLREKPPRGGVSVLSESVAVDEQLKNHSCRLLDAVNWHGIAMVEYRIAEDGRAYLMEVNTRFWGSLQLAIDAGVDFPWLLYQISNGDMVCRIDSYKTGQRLRWLLGDIDSLYLVLRDREFRFTEKLRAITRFITPHPFKTRHEVNRLGDPKPFFWELKQYIKDLI